MINSLFVTIQTVPTFESIGVYWPQSNNLSNSEDLLEDFIDWVKKNKPSPVSFSQARDNLRVCLAARESAKIGKPVYLK